MKFFLGVDGGGTGTRGVVIDEAGALLGAAEGGTGNWQAVGAERAGETLRGVAGAALARAGISEGELSGAFFGLAGVRDAGDAEVVGRELAPLGLGGAVRVGGDLEAAHAGALPEGLGAVVIAGTGSAAWARGPRGDVAQCGGWGWLVDDAGGGYWLALRGLRAACEAEDGRGAATELGARAAAFFDAAELREILRELHLGKKDRAAVAGFAREVRAAAVAGDTVAAEAVKAAGVELLRLATAARDRVTAAATVDSPRFPLAVVGGLGMGEVVAGEAGGLGFDLREPWGPPVLGAALRAAELGGAKLDAAAQTRLLAAWKTRHAAV